MAGTFGTYPLAFRQNSDPQHPAASMLPSSSGGWRSAGPDLAIAALALAAAAACDGGAAVADRVVIRLDTVVELDFSRAPEGPGPQTTVAYQPSRDRYVVAAFRAPHSLLVFDGDGSFVRSFGRRGPGPGELDRVARLLFDAGDSLWVVGYTGASIWRPTLVFARAITVDAVLQDVAPAPGGGLYISGHGAPGSRFAVASLLAGDGTIHGVAVDSAMQPSRPADARRLLTATGGDLLWVAGFIEYDVQLTDGRNTLRHFTEPPQWWKTIDVPRELELYLASSSAILDISADSAGRLWLLGIIPTIRDELISAVRAAGPEGISQSLRPLTGDHHLFVLEPDSGRMLADSAFDYLPLTFLNDSLASMVVPDETLGWRVFIVRYSLDEG